MVEGKVVWIRIQIQTLWQISLIKTETRLSWLSRLSRLSRPIVYTSRLSVLEKLLISQSIVKTVFNGRNETVYLDHTIFIKGNHVVTWSGQKYQTQGSITSKSYFFIILEFGSLSRKLDNGKNFTSLAVVLSYCDLSECYHPLLWLDFVIVDNCIKINAYFYHLDQGFPTFSLHCPPKSKIINPTSPLVYVSLVRCPLEGEGL